MAETAGKKAEEKKGKKSGGDGPSKMEKFITLVASRYPKNPRRKRTKNWKIWENPFLFRTGELIMATITVSVFLGGSLPIHAYESLILHTMICGPAIPIFALYSSTVMLDNNPQSIIVTYVLLSISAVMYATGTLYLASIWYEVKRNLSRYSTALFSLGVLLVGLLILLMVDIFSVPCHSICRKCNFIKKLKERKLTKKKGKSEPASAVEPSVT